MYRAVVIWLGTHHYKWTNLVVAVSIDWEKNIESYSMWIPLIVYNFVDHSKVPTANLRIAHNKNAIINCRVESRPYVPSCQMYVPFPSIKSERKSPSYLNAKEAVTRPDLPQCKI